MSLISALAAADKKGLFKSTDYFINYNTGLAPLDFANGFVYEKEDGEKIPITGIMGGTFITIIGISGSGKTTLGDQIAYSLIRNFENGLMIHFDVEKTALKNRITDICGADPHDPRIILQKDNVAIEDVMDALDQICEEKERGGDEYKYELDNGLFTDSRGKPLKVYVPTVFIIDSLPAFNSRNRKEEELEGQMSGGREASQISQFYTKCLNKMSKYNVTIIAINHIKSKVEINQFQQSLPQLMMLKQGESLPRGSAPIYYAQNIFRCNATKGNIYTLEDNGFEGFMCSVQIAKTKSSFIGSTVNLCFNRDIGFDPIYSLYEFAQQAGIVEGRNPNLYLKDAPEFKFSRKNFRKKFIDNEDFRHGILQAVKPYLMLLIGSKTLTKREKDRYVPIGALLVEDNGKIVQVEATSEADTADVDAEIGGE